jgi:HAD superfamily hydrolase (TIGR01459 family)
MAERRAMPDTAAPAIPVINGLAEIAERYDGFIVDLWGVMHDGVRPYPGACETLRALKAAGKRVVMLSNAPRRSVMAAERSAKVGVTADLYDALMTSGEETWHALRDRSDPWYARLGRRVWLFAAAYDRPFLSGLDLTEASGPADADFLLVTGAASGETVADYEARLVAARDAGLPLVCANPDLEVISAGRREICAGALALRYEQLGGSVRYHGKPHPSVYHTCFGLLGIADRRRILAIGDSLRTDVAGANGVGADCLLVTGGIHAEELGAAAGEHPDPAALGAICARAGQHPVAAIPHLVW